MEQMRAALEKAVKKVDAAMTLKPYREFGENKSAGFLIVSETGEKITSIDLSVRKNEFVHPYFSYMNNVSLSGASLNKMLSDKIYVVSANGIFRRIKDLVDIYVIYR